jgi:hypothetical protein
MRKTCENGLIFVKFHKIWFREFFRFRENFRNKLTKILYQKFRESCSENEKSQGIWQWSRMYGTVYVVSLFLYNITFFEDKINKVVL